MNQPLHFNHRLNRAEAWSRLQHWLAEAERSGGAQLDYKLRRDLGVLSLLVQLLRDDEVKHGT